MFNKKVIDLHRNIIVKIGLEHLNIVYGFIKEVPGLHATLSNFDPIANICNTALIPNVTLRGIHYNDPWWHYSAVIRFGDNFTKKYNITFFI